MATSYRDGLKYVDGRAYEPLVLRRHQSRSNPNREPYQTVFWADGTASCNCTGWATHKRCGHSTALVVEVDSGRLGAALRDLRRLSGAVSAREPATTGRLRTRRERPEYVIAPEARPEREEDVPTNVVYRRIKL